MHLPTFIFFMKICNCSNIEAPAVLHCIRIRFMGQYENILLKKKRKNRNVSIQGLYAISMRLIYLFLRDKYASPAMPTITVHNAINDGWPEGFALWTLGLYFIRWCRRLTQFAPLYITVTVYTYLTSIYVYRHLCSVIFTYFLIKHASVWSNTKYPRRKDNELTIHLRLTSSFYLYAKIPWPCLS